MLMMVSNLYTFYRELLIACYLPIERHDGITEALHSLHYELGNISICSINNWSANVRMHCYIKAVAVTTTRCTLAPHGTSVVPQLSGKLLLINGIGHQHVHQVCTRAG